VHELSQLHEIMDVVGPKSVVSQGGIYRWDDGRNVPDVMNSVYEYDPGFLADVYVNLGNSHEMHGTVIMARKARWLSGREDGGGQRSRCIRAGIFRSPAVRHQWLAAGDAAAVLRIAGYTRRAGPRRRRPQRNRSRKFR